MNEKEKTSSSWTTWMKVAAVLASIIGSAVGSYKAARSDSKAEVQAGYAVMKEAVEHLEQNQKMMWELMMKTYASRSPASVTSSPVVRLESLPKSIPVLKPFPRNMDEVMQQRPK